MIYGYIHGDTMSQVRGYLTFDRSLMHGRSVTRPGSGWDLVLGSGVVDLRTPKICFLRQTSTHDLLWDGSCILDC